MPDSIKQLSAAVAAGDAAAVESFYRAYFDFLLRAARRATQRDENFCLDVVQDSVLRIIRSIRPIETEPQLLAWLRIVVRTVAYDHLRSEQRRAAREHHAVEIHGCDDFPYGLWDESQIVWLKTKLDALDEQLRKLIELRFDHQWTLQRIAESLGLTVGTIDGRLRRALRNLRADAAETFADE